MKKVINPENNQVRYWLTYEPVMMANDNIPTMTTRLFLSFLMSMKINNRWERLEMSNEYMASKLGVTSRTIRAAKKELQDLGAITIVNTKTEGKGNEASKITLQPSRIIELCGDGVRGLFPDYTIDIVPDRKQTTKTLNIPIEIYNKLMNNIG